MKAKDLAELLMKTPDAIVVHNEYTGGLTPVLSINTITRFEKGSFVTSEGGNNLDKEGYAKVEIVILSHDLNK